MKKWISILLSVSCIAIGATSSLFVHNTFKWKVIDKPSTLANAIAAANSQVKPKDLKSIISDNQKSVFLIDAPNAQGGVLGSGFLYDDKGDIITNAHVVDGVSTVTVKTADSSSLKGTVIGIGTSTDVALIRVPELAGKTPVAILKGNQAAVGDGVIALGSPLGLQNTATTGIISGLNRNFEIEKYIYNGVYQISAPISPGNSGGPLLDDKTGQVIGINSAKVGEETIGFSIPIDQVIPLVEGWVNSPSVPAVNKSASSDRGNFVPSTSVVTTDMAEGIVRSFYHSIASHDYVKAYSLFGSDWQSKTSYEDFRQGYINTLSVQITNLTTSSIDENVQVFLIIEAYEQIGDSKKVSQYQLTYSIGQENNALKILQGTGKAI